jgi:hypothetical protein
MTRFYHKSIHIGQINTGFRKIAILTSFLLGFIITSCEKEPTMVGTDILPQSDFVSIGGTDTIVPVSFSMYDQKVRTDNSPITYLGEIHDPYFGTTSASFVTQLRLAKDWNYNSFILDSVRLFLTFNNVIGGTSGTHYLSFYEIQDQLYKDTAYYSNQNVTLGGFQLENIPLPTLAQDSANRISIKLPNAMFGSYLLRDTAMLFHSNTVPDFRTFFKGLQFKINSTGDPLLVTLDLANTTYGYYPIEGNNYDNFFLVFGHREDGTKEEYYYIIDAINTNVSFSLYEHNFEAADADKIITHYNNPSYRDTLTYLQSINGLYTRIVLPGLKALKDSPDFRSNIAINKARLTIPYFYDNNHYTNAKAPKQLYLRYRTTSGAKPFVQDMLVGNNQEFFDGTIDTVKHVYNFNLPTFVQAYFEDTSGEILPELELMQGTGINNLILKANASRTPLRFEFSYTRF